MTGIGAAPVSSGATADFCVRGPGEIPTSFHGPVAPTAAFEDDLGISDLAVGTGGGGTVRIAIRDDDGGCSGLNDASTEAAISDPTFDGPFGGRQVGVKTRRCQERISGPVNSRHPELDRRKWSESSE